MGDAGVECISDIAARRAATNALLAELREGRLAPAAVARFFQHAAHRSLCQAVRRPAALAELTALDALLLALAAGRGPGRRWVMASWALAITHLGLLGDRARLTGADLFTLIRGSIPVLPGGASRCSGLLAIALDLADGRLARRQGTASLFGDYAGTFADAAYWTWLDPSRAMRTTAVAAWALPVLTVAASCFVATCATWLRMPQPSGLAP